MPVVGRPRSPATDVGNTEIECMMLLVAALRPPAPASEGLPAYERSTPAEE